jgi:Rieske Fe-S protein
MSDPKGPSRRTFLDGLLGGSAVASLAAILYPILTFLKPPEESTSMVSSVLAGTVDGIPPNSGKIINFGRKPVLLVRRQDGEFKAFSAVCTHLACNVQFRSDMGLIWCACHNGRYDLNGRNIAGPPPRPLEPYRVDVKDDQVFVSKMA